MRGLLIACFLMLIVSQINAQSLNAGVRANAGYRLQSDLNGDEGDLTTLSGEHLSLAPEYFLRYEFRKKWVVEASYNQTRNNQTIIARNDIGWRDTLDSKAKYYDVTLSGQYEIGSRQFRNSKLFKAMHNYLGISLGMLFVNEELVGAERSNGLGHLELNNKSHSFWTGLNYTAAFDFGKHFRIVSGAYFKLCPDVIFASDKEFYYTDPKVQFGLQLGGAYQIF